MTHKEIHVGILAYFPSVKFSPEKFTPWKLPSLQKILPVQNSPAENSSSPLHPENVCILPNNKYYTQTMGNFVN